MLRLAAVMAWLGGLGFGMPAAYGTWYYGERGFVRTFRGFPAYDADRSSRAWGSTRALFGRSSG